MNEALAREGIRFERRGSGAVLWVGNEAVKASSAGRDCSMTALQERFGEPAIGHEQPARETSARPAQPVDRETAHSPTYAQERARHHEERTARRDRLRDRQSDEWRGVADRHRGERADIFKGSWRGHGDLLNAARSQLAARQAREKADLRDQQKVERARLQQEQARFPAFKEWFAQKNPELAQRWRYRERQPATIEGPMFEQPAPQDIRAFEAVVDGGIVHYRLAGSRGSPAFTDRGKVIEIGDSQRREAVLAALQLSAQKWGTFTVHGDERFQRRCVELAVEHGFKIANPGLQQAIANARERARAERSPVPRPAVRSIAEAYRLQFEEVVRESGTPKTDPSRFDSEVAVRLRLTGHHRDGIFLVIREGAATARPGERRDWDAYARRAVDFAFGVPGSQRAHSLELRREHLLRIEGRSLEVETASRGRGRAPFGR